MWALKQTSNHGLLAATALHALMLWAVWAHGRAHYAAPPVQTLVEVSVVGEEAQEEKAPVASPRVAKSNTRRDLPAVIPAKTEIQVISAKAIPANISPSQNMDSRLRGNDKELPTPPGKSQPATQQPIYNSPFLNNPPPPYPQAAQDRGIEGNVLLAVTVSPQGTALQVHITDSSGFAILDNAAREAVSNWRFLPALQGGQPAQGRVNIPVEFHL